MCFCDVSKIVVNSKILIISGAPIRVIFQNSVTYGMGTKFLKFVDNLFGFNKLLTESKYYM